MHTHTYIPESVTEATINVFLESRPWLHRTGRKSAMQSDNASNYRDQVLYVHTYSQTHAYTHMLTHRHRSCWWMQRQSGSTYSTSLGWARMRGMPMAEWPRLGSNPPTNLICPPSLHSTHHHQRYLKRKQENLECPDRATKYVKRCSVYVYVQSNYSGTLAAEYLAKCNVS